MESNINLAEVQRYLTNLQNNICSQLEEIDGGTVFLHDDWVHEDRIFGKTRVIKNGNVFEKGGVNFSHVKGNKLPQAASVRYPELVGQKFDAVGVSIVLHPKNPYVPTSHFNVRFFLSEDKDGKPIFWFGGGYDLTPYYGFIEDCVHWHKVANNACSNFGDDLYSKYKRWADDYFFLYHRNECRGVGGLFFDDLNEWGFDKSFAFMQGIGNSYLEAYIPIVKKRMNTPYGDKERSFQKYRRGRYVEFNLLIDRGTIFGLQSKGRTESILMSMPPEVTFDYNYQVEPNSKEENLTKFFLEPKDWLSVQTKTASAI